MDYFFREGRDQVVFVVFRYPDRLRLDKAVGSIFSYLNFFIRSYIVDFGTEPKDRRSTIYSSQDKVPPSLFNRSFDSAEEAIMHIRLVMGSENTVRIFLCGYSFDLAGQRFREARKGKSVVGFDFDGTDIMEIVDE